jgi:two-component system, OmpR family, phosphate regulon sensor histidine kinase PhoR
MNTVGKISNTNAILDHQRLDSLINSMSDGVIAVDEKALIAVYNGAALNILDVNTIHVGQPVSEVMQLLNEKNEPIDIRRFILKTKTQVISRDYKIKYSDDSIANLYLSISPVHLGYGEKGDRGFVMIIRDITREKSLEEERDEFISVVSHELRTPIAIAEGAISNAQYVVEKTKDLDKVTDALDIAHKQTIFLEGMINDLSTLSRAERGILEGKKEDINVHELVENLRDNYTPEAESKGLKLYIDIDPNLEILHTSKLYVQEILQNFITNAIKYTEAGNIAIYAKKQNDGVLFSVHDTGIGISKGDQARVFDKFFRSEDYHTRQQKGTGLGLHVTRKLAQLASAQITLESELGKGSMFSIYFPNLK